MKYFDNSKMERSPLSAIRAWALIFNYFIGYLFVYPTLASFITIAIDSNASEIPAYMEWFIYIWMILISMILGWPILKESWRKRGKIKRMLVSVLIAFFQLYFISAFGSLLASLLSNNPSSANQLEIVESLNHEPLMTFFLVTIYAPIVEELVFRGAIFRHFRQKYNFIFCSLLSGFTFGMIHVMSSLLEGNFADGWYLIVYMGLGVLFSKVYEDNQSIYATMLLHFINNFISILASMFI